MNVRKLAGRNMNAGKLARQSLRVLIFGGFVLAMVQAVSVVLLSPAQRITIVILLTLGSIAMILAACAWLLRKLWAWSGGLSELILPKSLMAAGPPPTRENEAKEQS